MMRNSLCMKALRLAGAILALLGFINSGGIARAQTVFVVDQFNPSGIGGKQLRRRPDHQRLGKLVRGCVSILGLGFHQRRQQ